MAVVWGRWAVLHSALSWAVAQGHLRRDPLEGMRAPLRPVPRKHLLPAEVARLLAVAAGQVERATANLAAAPGNGRLIEALFVAEQTRLLVRLAADTGARRGELAVLRLADLDGRVLTIERGLLEVLGTTKTHRNRRVTLGATTTALIVEHFESWRHRVGTAQVVADWIFAADFRRLSNARADLLSHRFERLRLTAGLPEACLHRLRHSVGQAWTGLTALVREQEVRTSEEAARLGMRGSPTILVDGQDPFGAVPDSTRDAGARRLAT